MLKMGMLEFPSRQNDTRKKCQLGIDHFQGAAGSIQLVAIQESSLQACGRAFA
jgi:hypothetical protein